MDTALRLMQMYGKDVGFAVLGILGGGVISFFLYRRSLLRTEISYACEYTRFLWSRIPAFSNITLTHEGQQLRDPRRVLFYVWNSGNTTIEGAKIARADPVRLRAGDVHIINAAIVKTSRDVICAGVQPHVDGDIRIDFDYLDAGDGFVIEALYDCTQNKDRINNCPELLGTIKGVKGPPINRDIAFENRALKHFGQSTALLLSLLASSALLVFQIFEIVDERSWFLLVPKILTAALLLLLSIGMIVALLYTLQSYRIPMILKTSNDRDALPASYSELVERLEAGNDRLAAENALIEEASTLKRS
jgi:hypothetical protein